jgi:ABC-type sugar transport system permease subunit
MILAFQRWNVVDPAKPFVGLDNFRELFRDKLFWNAMKNTALFSLQVPISMFLSLLLAIAVNRPTKSMALLRTVYYLPVVTAGVSTTIVWRWIFNKDFGILNYVLGIFGVPKIPWLTSPNTALIAIMLLSIWQSLGSQMVIFLAGLQSIPQAFYEAASIDGANRFQRFSKITLPLLKPTTMFVLITSVIGSFQVFTPVYVLTQGGPLRSTDVVFYHIWEAAWIELRMGYAAAQSWMLFLVLLVLTYFQFKLFGKESWQQYF